MEEQDEAYMRLAIAQAHYSKRMGDVPFGAVIVRHGKVIAAAYNSEHTHHDVTDHAETKAISEACKILGTRDLSDCTIYCTVEPCTMCAGAIFNACVWRVVFGMSRDDVPRLFRRRNIRLWELAREWHYQPIIVSGILKNESIAAFLEYKQAFRVKPTGKADSAQYNRV